MCSCKLGAGEHICILGPNGCGKSTLIKTITRECYPLATDGSSVSILGRERWNIFELRSLLGIVSPDLLTSCTTDATGRDVVLSGFFSSTRIFPHHSPKPELLSRSVAALERLGIAHLAHRSVAHMSSGEAKRTLDRSRSGSRSAGRCCSTNSSNALDIAAQVQLRETMRELAQSGLGILLVTHHVAEIIREIERVVVSCAKAISSAMARKKKSSRPRASLTCSAYACSSAARTATSTCIDRRPALLRAFSAAALSLLFCFFFGYGKPVL